ncbi:MAG TPA: hypothetical protein VNG29_00485 [Candidatus Paceibacterota bacterium]|nr:hypothetical protein [Candidatus Paceibacterota bacterium]
MSRQKKLVRKIDNLDRKIKKFTGKIKRLEKKRRPLEFELLGINDSKIGPFQQKRDGTSRVIMFGLGPKDNFRSMTA